MRALRSVSIVLAIALAATASAADFDGAVPLTCTAEQAHDCLPTNDTCSRMEPQSKVAPVFKLDFAKKQARSPFRTAVLPVLHTANNKSALVFQGADLGVAWSASVNKQTGALTVAIADTKGAYVVFGQCKMDAAKPVAPKK